MDAAPMRTVCRLFVVALVVAATGCAASTAGERVTAAELHRLVPGATLHGAVAGGGTFDGTYHRDGTVAIRTDDDSDTGTGDSHRAVRKEGGLAARTTEDSRQGLFRSNQ